MTGLVLALALLCVSVVVGAIILAVRYPSTAVRLAALLVRVLLIAWCVQCAVGIGVQMMQGPGPDAVATDTVLHYPHRVLGHGVVMLTWLAWAMFLPMSIERLLRVGGVLRLFVGWFFTWLSLLFVLASSFTGYLGGPPTNDMQYVRFRVLHTMGLPLIALLLLGCWFAVARRYRIDLERDALQAKTEVFA